MRPRYWVLKCVTEMVSPAGSVLPCMMLSVEVEQLALWEEKAASS